MFRLKHKRWWNVGRILTVFEEILQWRADLGVGCGARGSLQRIILEPRRNSTYNATNQSWASKLGISDSYTKEQTEQQTLRSNLTYNHFNSALHVDSLEVLFAVICILPQAHGHSLWIWVWRDCTCMNISTVWWILEDRKHTSVWAMRWKFAFWKKLTLFPSSDHLIADESQALSSGAPRSVIILASCWPVGSLWCKSRAAPETRWARFMTICVISEVLARMKSQRQTRRLPDSVPCRCVCASGSVQQLRLCLTLTSIQEKPNVVHTGSLSTNHNSPPFFRRHSFIFILFFFALIYKIFNEFSWLCCLRIRTFLLKWIKHVEWNK